MKRSKQTIINRRIMHRYQQQYRIWHKYVKALPLLRIDPNIKWNETEWLKYCRAGVLLIKTKDN